MDKQIRPVTPNAEKGICDGLHLAGVSVLQKDREPTAGKDCTMRPELLLDDLKTLLEKQMELAQAGSTNGVEALSRQANRLVGKIAETGVLGRAEFKGQREQLQKLYQDLCLVIAVQKAEADEALKLVRKGKKTVAAYRNSI